MTKPGSLLVFEAFFKNTRLKKGVKYITILVVFSALLILLVLSLISSSSLWKHAHGQRWLADKMQGTLDWTERSGMIWVRGRVEMFYNRRMWIHPIKVDVFWLADLLSVKTDFRACCRSLTSLDLWSAMLTWHLTYWFVVSQYVNIRPVLNLDTPRLENFLCQFNDWHIQARYNTVFENFLFIRCVIFVREALSGNSLYRLGSQAVDQDTGYILKELEKKCGHP